jgi:large subunit ribosomal protein L5
MAEAQYEPRLRKQYREAITAEMIKEFGYKNALEVPRIDKIVINMGIGEAVADSKVSRPSAILPRSRQNRPSPSRKSIATYKLREDADRRQVRSASSGCTSSSTAW